MRSEQIERIIDLVLHYGIRTKHVRSFSSFSAISVLQDARTDKSRVDSCSQWHRPSIRSLKPCIGLELVDITDVSSRVSYRDCGSLQSTTEKGRLSTWYAKKTAHGFLCNNFAYSQPIFIIFGLYKPQEICNWKVCFVSPYHDLCNYTTLWNLDCDFIHVHLYQTVNLLLWW